MSNLMTELIPELTNIIFEYLEPEVLMCELLTSFPKLSHYSIGQNEWKILLCEKNGWLYFDEKYYRNLIKYYQMTPEKLVAKKYSRYCCVACSENFRENMSIMFADELPLDVLGYRPKILCGDCGSAFGDHINYQHIGTTKLNQRIFIKKKSIELSTYQIRPILYAVIATGNLESQHYYLELKTQSSKKPAYLCLRIMPDPYFGTERLEIVKIYDIMTDIGKTLTY